MKNRMCEIMKVRKRTVHLMNCKQFNSHWVGVIAWTTENETREQLEARSDRSDAILKIMDWIQKSITDCEKKNIGGRDNRNDEEGQEGV